ncbi:hypothetical protein JVU11DRAFT_10712 [Chiua virens]|nr:hypothetical protein JVU11DRAFT_10712 [Chiua virens]
MHSLQLNASDAEQVHNPWTSHSNDRDISPSTTTPGNSHHLDLVCSLDDALVYPGLTTGQEDQHMILSPSPSPQSVPSIPAFLPMQNIEVPQTDPRIASLKVIFPDFDDAVISSVLESTDNDHDRALDVLLGMNDPSFVSPVPPPSASPNNQFQTAPSIDAQRLSQEALDEQLARRLALEEQQEATTPAWQPQGVEGQSMYQTYQPRRGGRGGWGGWTGGQGGQPQVQPQTQGQGGKDTMAEFQEGFNRIAESGKKTFSSIVTKVRAKMQEFEQGQGWSGSQNSYPGQGPQGQPSYYTPPQPQGSGQGAYAQPYQPPQSVNPQRQTSQSRPARTSVSPPRSGVLNPITIQPVVSESPQRSSYYDPNARGYDLYDEEEDIQIIDRTTPSTTPAVPPAALAAAQRSVTPPQTNSTTTPPPPSSSATSSPPSYSSPMSPPSHSRPSSISSLPARSLSPTTKPGAPAGVDFSKLGLLPKRPISLVRPQSPPAAGGTGASGGNAPRVAVAHSQSTADNSTDREEPEFIENPFEDPK